MTRVLLVLLSAAALRADVLWRPPAAPTAELWRCGPAGCDHAPAPPFRFEKEEAGGSNPKLRVRDARGQTWSVKFGGEVIPECFGSRYLTALGYLTEPSYFVAAGKIEGVHNLRTTRRVVKPDGAFKRARFELRGQPDLEFLPNSAWDWSVNPFRGTHELAGLKIVMMLLSNWDAKDASEGADSNTAVFRVGSERIYSMYDWGASLGRWGGALRRDESDCAGFTLDTPKFVKGVENGEVRWGYSGKHAEEISRGITVADVRWLLPYLERITPEMLRTALSASGATARQSSCWAGSIEARVRQLQSLH